MRLNFLFFLAIPIMLTATGELLLKNSINNLNMAMNGATSLIQILSSPFVYISISFIFVGGILWLVGMSKFQLSFMYPFLALNYLAIFAGSIIFLKEKVTIYSVLAIIFIGIGLIFISQSKYAAKKK